MKQTILTLFIGLLATVAVSAQTPVDKLEVSNLGIEQADEKVIVRFNAKLARKAIRRNEALWMMPVITDGTHKVALAPVVVRSGKADMSYRRTVKSGDKGQSPVQTVRPSESFTYHSSADFQWWMHGASIYLENLISGCGGMAKGTHKEISAQILAVPEVDEPAVPEAAEVAPQPEPEPVIETTGQEMERTFSFVLSASEFDPDNLVVYDDDREAGIVIYYKASGKKIEADYMWNRQALINLEAAIKLIDESPDSRVKHIVIAGFSSPEGSFEVNDRLAFERAVSVKEFIMGKTGIPAELILLHNGSADWRGLRLLIAGSDMPDRDDILHIIDTMEIWNSKTQKGRMGEIMRYKNGSAYFYMKENFFPKLRNGAFIRVYYEDNNPE